jgi:F420-0:gamma-glutamyl ligase
MRLLDIMPWTTKERRLGAFVHILAPALHADMKSITQALGRILRSSTSQRISVIITDSLMMPAWCSTTILLGLRAPATGVDAVVKGKPTQLP